MIVTAVVAVVCLLVGFVAGTSKSLSAEGAAALSKLNAVEGYIKGLEPLACAEVAQVIADIKKL